VRKEPKLGATSWRLNAAGEVSGGRQSNREINAGRSDDGRKFVKQSRTPRVKPILYVVLAVVMMMAACAPDDAAVDEADTVDDDVAADEETRELVVYGQSGSLEDVMREEIIPQFEADHNVEVVYAGGTSGDNLGKVQAERGNPQADVIIFNDVSLEIAKRQDLLAPLDSDIVTNLDCHRLVKRPVKLKKVFQLHPRIVRRESGTNTVLPEIVTNSLEWLV
jgi:hypothetical protein